MYLTYVTTAWDAFIDRALYLPKSWTSDPQRCTSGIPAQVRFAAKPPGHHRFYDWAQWP